MLQLETVDVLSNSPEKKLNQLCVNEGVNLFIEDATVPYPYDHLAPEMITILQTDQRILSKWETEFELDHNRFTVKFNDPRQKLNEMMADGAERDITNKLYNNYIQVDKRLTVLELKL